MLIPYYVGVKINLVLNKATSFEAIDGSGGIDPFILNVGTS
jgi:hypothetical protein